MAFGLAFGAASLAFMVLAACERGDGRSDDVLVGTVSQALGCEGGSDACNPDSGEGTSCTVGEAGTFGLQGDCPNGLWCNLQNNWCQSALLPPGAAIPGVSKGCSALLSGQVCQSGFCNTAQTACGCQVDQDCQPGETCNQSSFDCQASSDAAAPDAASADAAAPDAATPDAATDDAATPDDAASADAASADATLADASPAAPQGKLLVPALVPQVPTPGNYEFSVQLGSQPTAPVTLSFASNAPAVLRTPSDLIIAPTDWNKPTTVSGTTGGSAAGFTGSLGIRCASKDPSYDGVTASVPVELLAAPRSSSQPASSCALVSDRSRAPLGPLALISLVALGALRRRRKG